MGNALVPIERARTSRDLHPAVYAMMIGLSVLFVAAAWVFFAGGYSDLDLLVISVFFAMAIGIPYILSRVGRHDEASIRAGARDGPLRDWLAGDFEDWQSRTSARAAATEILLPLCAVAFGLVAIGAVFHFAG